MALRDPAAVAEARRLARQRHDQRLSALLNQPEAIGLYSDDDLGLLRERRDTAISAMRRALKSTKAPRRVAAALALERLGDAAGRAAIPALLADSGARLPLLLKLEFVPALAARPDVRRWLLDRLNDVDERTQCLALEVAGKLGLAEAAGRLVELAQSRDTDPRGRAAFWAARRGRPSDVLEAIEPRLKSATPEQDDRYWLVEAAAHLSGSDDRDVSRRCLRLCETALARSTQNDGSGSAAVQAIRKHGGAEAADALRRVAQSEGQAGLRGDALLALAEVNSTEGLALAVEMLSQPEVRHMAAAAVGVAAEGTRDAALVELLENAARHIDQAWKLSCVVDALLRIGGDRARAAAEQLTARLLPSHAVRIRQAIRGVTPQTAAKRLADLGVIRTSSTRPAATRTTEIEDDGARRFGDVVLLALGDAGVLLAFDVETGTLPVGHDELIRRFAETSGGAFRPEAILETWHQESPDDANGDYTVQFVANDRLYRFGAKNLGDWYDVAAVLTAVNTALEDTGVVQRFTPLAGDGQVAMLVFAPPQAVAQAFREGLLMPSDDPDEARRKGVEFERHVLENLKTRGTP